MIVFVTIDFFFGFSVFFFRVFLLRRVLLRCVLVVFVRRAIRRRVAVAKFFSRICFIRAPKGFVLGRRRRDGRGGDGRDGPPRERRDATEHRARRRVDREHAPVLVAGKDDDARSRRRRRVFVFVILRLARRSRLARGSRVAGGALGAFRLVVFEARDADARRGVFELDGLGHRMVHLRPLDDAEPSEPSPFARHGLVRGVVHDAREDLIDHTERLGEPVDARGGVSCDRGVQEATHGDAPGDGASGESTSRSRRTPMESVSEPRLCARPNTRARKSRRVRQETARGRCVRLPLPVARPARPGLPAGVVERASSSRGSKTGSALSSSELSTIFPGQIANNKEI